MTKWLIVPVLCLTACTTTMRLTHPTKSIEDTYRDEVECKALAQQGAGDGFGLVHEGIKADLLLKCYKGRGYVQAQPQP